MQTVSGRERLGVVFIHGFNSSSAMWQDFESLIADDSDLDFVVPLPFSYATRLWEPHPLRRIPTIDTVADSLKEYLDTEAHGLSGLMLVGHSQGGLIGQRLLVRMLAEGRGADLTRIRRVVLFACPNDGSQLALTLRRGLLRRNPQERQLRPLDEQINDIKRAVLRDVVHAHEVTARTCPIPFSVYAGESDDVVPAASARSVFPDAGVLPGDHFGIVRPDSRSHRSFTTLKRLILAAADGDPPGAGMESAHARRHSAPGATPTERPGRPVEMFTDPFALEVHHALDGGEHAHGLEVLPHYVERAHDRRLAGVVGRATAGQSAIAVLVGGSSTGKTRACWEAVKQLPPGWLLWHPISPGRPEAALASLPLIGPRTVVWLNDIHHYLLPAAFAEPISAGLRTLLSDPDRGPVLVLGTTWEDHWSTLTQPSATAGHPYAQARELLAGCDIGVPEAFTSREDLSSARQAATVDPRWAAALATAQDHEYSQFLAGAPALLDRYRNAPVPAKALLHAAMDARRLGHSLVLPLPMLVMSAEQGYLTESQFQRLRPDWLERALAYLGEPVHGESRPLSPVIPRHGQPMGAAPGYKVADYLDEFGSRARRTTTVPAALWNSLIIHAAPDDLAAAAQSARDRGLMRLALRLSTAALQKGHTGSIESAFTMLSQGMRRPQDALNWLRKNTPDSPAALFQAAKRVEGVGLWEEAEDLYRRAAQGGDVHIIEEVAQWMGSHWPHGAHAAERRNEVLTLYRRAIQLGSDHARKECGSLLWQMGRSDEAIDLYRQAAQNGRTDLLPDGLWMLESAGLFDEAVSWLRKKADEGNTEAILRTAAVLFTAGRGTEAVDWLRDRIDRTDKDAVRATATLLSRMTRTDEALTWYEHAVKLGDHHSLRPPAVMLEYAGRLDDALSWLRRITGSSDSRRLKAEALDLTVAMIRRRWEKDRVMTWLRNTAQEGDVEAMRRLAGLLRRSGDTTEALGWYRRAAEAGNGDAMLEAGDLVEESSGPEEALDWYERAAAAGNSFGLWRAFYWYQKTDRIEQALALGQRAVDAGQHARTNIAEMLWKAGRKEEAWTWYESATAEWHGAQQAARMLQSDGRIEDAVTWLQKHELHNEAKIMIKSQAHRLRKAGQLDEAREWYERASASGDGIALSDAADMMTASGDADKVVDWLRNRVVAGDTHAPRVLASTLKNMGRIEEALEWCRRDADNRVGDAAIAAAHMLSEAGRIEEAILWLHEYAADLADRGHDSRAVRVASRLLEQAGQSQKAKQLQQYGWELDGSIAEAWQTE
ncbi:tetratricopeptide repeat protein [Streptomyces sp. NEAU-H22]|uniref:tetratricopeptide repeat protein n=1 Tax=Streptomyces sp. NEAU-H22 TaxID=2994655 RepID=UPI002250FB93|nr:tetratricopeptide repeat protein [Streptomyces sp. NEAU-H22]MCX3290639.1 tetratricopeptide repeat protein [Streptomyces sp. NEAU-H22]